MSRVIAVIFVFSMTIVLAATGSTGASTSTVSMKSVEEPVKKDWKFSVSAGLEGQNYFNDYNSISLLTLNPRATYTVPKTKLDLSAGIIFKRNEYWDGTNSYDVDEVDLSAFYPVWKNEFGTAFDAFALLEGYQFSTEKSAWDDGINRLYVNLGLKQKLGNFSFKVAPNIAYYVTNPKYKHGDMDARAAIDTNISYNVTKSFSVYHTQKYRRYVQAEPYNLFLTYFGVKYFYKKFSLDTSLSFADSNLEKLWNLNTKADSAWANILVSYSL